MAAQDDARKALLEGITRVAEESTEVYVGDQAEILKNLALTYRYVMGGPQPGGTVEVNS